MEVEKFDFSTHAGLMVFYGQLAVNLAIKLRVPGFLEIAPKWSPTIVMAALVEGEKRKQRRMPNPDFSACLEIVRALDPDLARTGRGSEATRRAKTLRNLVSKLRQRLKRERLGTKRQSSAKVVRLFGDDGSRVH
jgi:hypothetical protein